MVDGGSTDRTRSLVEQYAAVDPRVRLIDNPRRIPPAALNEAVLAMRSNYLVRIDAHSTVAPDYVERAMRHLRRLRLGRRRRAQGRHRAHRPGPRRGGRARLAVRRRQLDVPPRHRRADRRPRAVRRLPPRRHREGRRVGRDAPDQRGLRVRPPHPGGRVRAAVRPVDGDRLGGPSVGASVLPPVPPLRPGQGERRADAPRFGEGPAPRGARRSSCCSPSVSCCCRGSRAGRSPPPCRTSPRCRWPRPPPSVGSSGRDARRWVPAAFAAMHLGWGLGFWEGMAGAFAHHQDESVR